MRARHLSVRTERAYTAWIRRYIRYHGMRHPQELGDDHVIQFLTDLVAEHRVARSTQVQAMSARLQTEQGQSAYKRRQQIVEPVFAHIKHIRGITRLLRRGKTAVQAEIDLIATTHNLLKLYRHGDPQPASAPDGTPTPAPPPAGTRALQLPTTRPRRYRNSLVRCTK